MKIYAYTMVYDTGFAPSVYKKEFSLACCKTFLRYKIATEFLEDTEDIYLVGLCGKQLSERHKYEKSYFPVYIAKITNVVETKNYYSDNHYQKRPDSQYIFEDGKWFFTCDNPHHVISENAKNHKKELLENPGNEKDLFYIRGESRKWNYVLLSKEFAYFGNYFSKNGMPSFFETICNEREKACRGDLSPIKSINMCAQKELEKYVKNVAGKFSVQDNSNTIDAYFIDKKCKGEKVADESHIISQRF